MLVRPFHIVLVATLVPLSAATARADVFFLANGGRVCGRWLNPNETPLTSYEIETPSGGRLRLQREQVTQAVRQRPAELDFERMAPTYADTVDDQWALAEWCLVQRLDREREAVLRRVLDLDPDHVPARRALGYQQLGGRWVTTREWRELQGYVWYRGRWRLAQDVELLESERKRNSTQKEWAVKLRRWREQLNTDDAAEARAEIRAIDDPLAMKAITDEFRQEPYRAVKLMYVELLGSMGGAEALKFLVFASLNDLDEEVRVACVDQLVVAKSPAAVARYIETLEDKNNVRINLAAQALARLGDKSAVGPLIDALVTTHEIVIRPPGRTADTVSTSFQRSGGGGTASGGGSPFPSSGTQFSTGNQQQIIRRTAANSDVLTALVRITGGVNFSFDQRAWRYWHAAERQYPQTQLRNARRDGS